MENIQMGILGAVLAIQSIYDIRKKQIPLLVTLLGSLVGFILWIIAGNITWMRLSAFLPGMVCLLFAKISREAIGYGDGLILCMMGIYLEIDKLISLCLWAFLFAGLVALFLLVFGKKKGKQEIPFIPFLLIAFGVEVYFYAIS